MIYVDTSALVALLTQEEATARVTEWYTAETDLLVSADWCIAEFASALAAKQRAKQLRAGHSSKAQLAFDALATGGLRLLPVSRDAHRQAARLCQQPGSWQRAGDALHLAVALEAGATGLAGLDATMNASAQQLGLKLALAAR